jgi:salicylate hydroxylase
MCHPGFVADGKPNEFTSLDEMRERYKDWDPILTKLINLVPECLKWQNAEIEKLDTWVSRSGRVVLIGDSSHGMVPYMAQGAAMAVEDGIVVAECLARAKSTSEIPRLMRYFERLRLDRCHIILDAARNNGNIWHLADGPEQQKRDEQMRQRSTVRVATTAQENPNKWSDPKFQPWMFGHDAFAHV